MKVRTLYSAILITALFPLLDGCASSVANSNQPAQTKASINSKLTPQSNKASNKVQSVKSPAHKPIKSVAAQTKQTGLFSWFSRNITPADVFEKTSSQENPGDIWDRIRADFRIPLATDRPEVQAQIAWYKAHQEVLQRSTQRAEPYMYMVYEQTQARNLPAELVLLPVVESSYYPLAYSPAGAAGIWQLMPGTAGKFGLKRNWWYDGRKDVFASTHAALNYLDYLQKYFNGDWLLAMAAYNSGEGTVQNAIRRNAAAGKSTDFWSLQLPSATRAYIPQLLALANIVSNPDAYEVKLPFISDQPYVARVDVGSQIKLADAAKLAGMTLTEFKHLNPGYSRWTTEPTGTSHLLLPVDKIEDFKQRLAEMPSIEKTSLAHYKVQRGDTLESLAKHYEIAPQELQQLNRLKSKHLTIGKVLAIPTVSRKLLANDEDETVKTAITDKTITQNREIPQATTNHPIIARANFSHTVHSGETLSGIAQHYQVSVKQLRQWNQQATASKSLKPGTKLVIHKTSQALTQPVNHEKKPKAPTIKHYQVKSGDTLIGIARHHGISVTQLRNANKLRTTTLKAGSVLMIPKI